MENTDVYLMKWRATPAQNSGYSADVVFLFYFAYIFNTDPRLFTPEKIHPFHYGQENSKVRVLKTLQPAFMIVHLFHLLHSFSLFHTVPYTRLRVHGSLKYVSWTTKGVEK